MSTDLNQGQTPAESSQRENAASHFDLTAFHLATLTHSVRTQRPTEDVGSPSDAGYRIAGATIDRIPAILTLSASIGEHSGIVGTFSYPHNRQGSKEVYQHAVDLIRDFCESRGLKLNVDELRASSKNPFGPFGEMTETLILWISWKDDYQTVLRHAKLVGRSGQQPGV